MTVETGTTLSDLVTSNPSGNTAVSEGDDHIRLLKSVLQSQFPGVGGAGFSIPITVTEKEINWAKGLEGNLQAQIDDLIDAFETGLHAPQGTIMSFFQAAPPNGWTQTGGSNDSMLRVVSGSGGGKGGTVTPTSFSVNHSHNTSPHKITEEEMPAHRHASGSVESIRDTGGDNKHTSVYVGAGEVILTGSTTGGDVHTHFFTGTFNKTFTPKYIDIITAEKD